MVSNPSRPRTTSISLTRAFSLGALAMLVTGCQLIGQVLPHRGSDRSSAPTARPAVGDVQGSGSSNVSVADAGGRPPRGGQRRPGKGVVMGRAVDGVTGLPVADAGVSLLGLDQRTLTGPDGRFRFDGVASGTLTLVFGPADGYIASSRVVRLDEAGQDLGIQPLLPLTYSALIVPEYGGRIAACGETRVDFVTGALTQESAVWLTCLQKPEEFPAAPPAGRLPLAVVDLAPGDLVTTYPARLTIGLPAQPRYSAGVQLDLLRLDLERLLWTPTASLTVDPGGNTATGEVSAFGTFLVAAPPFGSFVAGKGDQPSLSGLLLTDGPKGNVPVAVFGPGHSIIYLAFDFARTNNTNLFVRTTDEAGEVVFESLRPYTDQGREHLPMDRGDGAAWPAGKYVTTVYMGEPLSPFDSLEWRVASAATPTSPPPTLPPQIDVETVAGGLAPPSSLASGAAGGSQVLAGSGGCQPPARWWPRPVGAGETLTDLAWRAGTDVGSLMAANCLPSDFLRAGQVIYLPRPPLDAKPKPSIWSGSGTYKPIYPVPYPTRAGSYPNPWGTGAKPYPTRPQVDPHATLPPGQPGQPAPGYGTPAPYKKTPKYATLPIPTTWYTPEAPLQPPVLDPGGPLPQPTMPPASGVPGAGQRGGGSAPGPGPKLPAPAPQPPAPGPPSQGPGQGLLPPKEHRPADPTLAPRPWP